MSLKASRRRILSIGTVVIANTFLLVACGGGGTATTPVSNTIETSVKDVNSPAASIIKGNLTIDISDILGNTLPSAIRLVSLDGGKTLYFEVPQGRAEVDPEVGLYTAYVLVYENSVPYTVATMPITISSAEAAHVRYELLEGSGAGSALGTFDQDGDLVLSRVELESNTDPLDATSVPGVKTLNWQEQRISSQEGWLRGELHAQSNHGIGTESTAELIRRAERLGLDFLAIMDRNTLDAPLDPEFRSNSVVLIPGMEWGEDENGVALVYGPRSLPSIPKSAAELSAAMLFIQAQGGLVFAAHPCYPVGSWNWNTNQLNGVQTWSMGWRAVPGISINQVHESNRIQMTADNTEQLPVADRVALDSRYIHPLAKAANLPGLSANGQSSMYWDYELNRGLRLTAIGGSQTGSPKVNMAEPVTYVYAKEKSLAGVLDGLRRGRTYISNGLNGPELDWAADIFDDGTIDTSIGGIVPLDEDVRFYCRVRGAIGKKIQVLINGSPSASTLIEEDDWTFTYVQATEVPVVYRIRIVGSPEDLTKGFGVVDTLAMTSPIYARGVVANDSSLGPLVEIENDYVDPSNLDTFMQFLEKSGYELQR